MLIAGVDFGSKLAGTTVLAIAQSPLVLLASQKGEDADDFLLRHLSASETRHLFFDAPLSLPGVYTQQPNCQDYMYRKGDRVLGAMSPMFLGGLTARAMRLRAQLEPLGINMYEAYPAAQAERLGLKPLGYKKIPAAIPDILLRIAEEIGPGTPLPHSVPTWHAVDALLALVTGLRWANGLAEFVGDPDEGGIWV